MIINVFVYETVVFVCVCIPPQLFAFVLLSALHFQLHRVYGELMLSVLAEFRSQLQSESNVVLVKWCTEIENIFHVFMYYNINPNDKYECNLYSTFGLIVYVCSKYSNV